MSWPSQKLGDVCIFVRGPFGGALKKEFFVDHGFSVYEQQHAIYGHFYDVRYFIDGCKFKELKRFELHPGDLIMSCSGTMGRLAIAPEGIGKGIINQALLKITPKANVDLGYLKYWLESETFQFRLSGNTHGAAIKNVASVAVLKEMVIPLPPLPEQKRIAAILDKADTIRRKRQQATRLTDDFLRAVFLDMFGDPVINPMGWKLLPLSTVGTLDRGKSRHRPRNDPALLEGAHPLIQTGEVANSRGYIKEYSATYSDLGLAQSKKWDAGTLCITIAANIAKTGILTFPACFPDSVVGFIPNRNVTVEFVQHWLGFLQKNLEANAPQAAQKNINLEILRGLLIPVPPVVEQERFSAVVTSVLAVEGKIASSSCKLGSVFGAICQKAFSGRL